MPVATAGSSPLGDYCDLYSDAYAVCPSVLTPPPSTGTGPGGSYDRPYIAPSLTYFGGTSSDAPAIDTPWPFPVALGGHAYNIDLKFYERSSVEPFREASDFNASPGEHSLTNEGAWKRNRSDWSWGAGQTWADDPDSSDKRFRASKGIDGWTAREMKLLPDTALVNPTGSTNLRLFTIGAYLYLIDGASIVSTTNPTSSYTAASVPAAIVSATTDGAAIYAAVTGTGIYKSVVGSGTAAAMGGAAGTYNAELVGYANGWLLAAAGPVVSSVAANGTMTTVFTHQNPAWTWTTIAPAPNAIYLAGNAGGHNEIFQVTVDQTTAALGVPVFAGGLPDGETLNTMVYYQSTMLLGTSRGLRLASIDGQGGVNVGPLINLDQPVVALHSQGEFVWFSWRDYDGDSTGIGRANLSVFTSPLVPAYASDLMATTQGQVSGITTWNGKRYFTVNGKGLYAQADGLVASGTIDQGNLTYSVFETKALMSLELVTEPLEGQIAMAVIDDHETSTPIGTATTHGSIGLGNVYSGHGVVSERLALQLVLTRGAVPTLGPVVRRWSMRALPLPSNVELFTVPIMLFETVNIDVGEGQDVHYDVARELAFLKNLERSRRPVTYQEGDTSYRVTVRATRRPQGLPYKWNANRTAIEGLFIVNLSTLED